MLERTILNSLVHNEEYSRKVLPYLKAEYFHNKSEQAVFTLIDDHINKYNALPSPSTIGMEMAHRKSDINEHEFKEIVAIIETLFKKEEWEMTWLLDKTERFCQEKAVYNAILKSVNIINGKEKTLAKGAIPQMLQDALGVSFDTHIGVDLIEDAPDWYDRIHAPYERVPFDIDMLNKITKGGLKKKTLNVLMGGVGFGKTLCMCHMAGTNLMMGKKVLYITLEMSEDQISERIYANMLNIPLDDLDLVQKEVFKKKVEALKERTPGKLIVHEYPTSGAGAANFRHLLNELKIKKNFEPDIIYIDYLNICMSSRTKWTTNMNTYIWVKMITEEIRGLAIEKDVPIMSATQINRDGFSSSNPGMEDTAESWGLPQTVDLLLILILNEELIRLGQYMVKQAKNRYSDMNRDNTFVIGMDRSKMRLYNVEREAQTLSKPPTSTPSSPAPQSISERALAMVKKPAFSFKEFQ